MRARISVDELNSAVVTRGHVTGCIVRSDQGSQFRGRKFLREHEYHGPVGSMGRVLAAGDNPTMESVLCAPTKQRPRAAILGHQRPVADSNRGLD